MKEELENYFDRLWPICRSITGEGLRQSLDILSEVIPLELTEVPTGTQVFDWEVPREWNIKDAFIMTPDGQKIADFKVNNLHVMGYSVPVDAEMSFEELESHLHYLPMMPDAIPYLTSYYKDNWGFGISANQYLSLPREGRYRVVIDSELKAGSLTFGECILQGQTYREVLISTYICHPSMANNELSGPLATAFLYRMLSAIPKRRYTYRFYIGPETIGALCFLQKRGDYLQRHLYAGYVLSCCADPGDITYKFSRTGRAIADRAALHVLRHTGQPYHTRDFDPTGSDERQYCSPGFNLPVGVITRTPDSQFPQYHTSLDNKEFISFDALTQTVYTLLEMVKTLEQTGTITGKIQHGEPRLGNRGLYADLNGMPAPPDFILRRKRILNFADGETEMLDVAERYGYYLPEMADEIDLLMAHGLVRH